MVAEPVMRDLMAVYFWQGGPHLSNHPAEAQIRTESVLMLLSKRLGNEQVQVLNVGESDDWGNQVIRR